MQATHLRCDVDLLQLAENDSRAYSDRLSRLAIERTKPTEEDILFYQEHGYWVTRAPVFSCEELAAVECAVDLHQMGHRDRQLPIELPAYLDWKPEHGTGRLRMSDYIAHMNDVVRRNLLIPEIGLIAAHLAGVQQIRLHNSSFVHKPPENRKDEFRVGWHVDKAYWQTSSSDKMLTAWIPLHDVTAENGTLTVIDKSHRWSDREDVIALRNERGFATADHEGLAERLGKLGIEFKVVTVEVPKGHVSFHHCLTFHGSGRNTSGKPRKAAVLHLQDGDNRFEEKTLSDGSKAQYKHDQMVRRDHRGLPDYADPVFCPVLWDEAFVSTASGNGRRVQHAI